MLPSRGRPGQTIIFEYERDLTHDDIFRLATDPTVGKVGPPILQRLKDNHHAIARYLASGRTVVETAELCGLTPQRVGDLERTDPAFQNLLAFYRDQVTTAGVDEAREFRGSLRQIGRGALEEIKERLGDDKARAAMETDELRRLAEMALDRTDAPPRTAQTQPPAPTHITFNMGPRTIQPKEGTVIEHESNEPTEPDETELEPMENLDVDDKKRDPVPP